ncbi:MAG TPA: hypothetical protein VH394_02385 [Thermoanaerobaculia bacterium]|jgi:Tol biopolymer transport system component|nr:hypothetical protein [Thermoanaerobaculia bacterium]
MLRAVRIPVVLIGFMLLAHIAQAGQIELLSKAGTGSDTATGHGYFFTGIPYPLVSADGRWVAFASSGVNLMAGQKDRNDLGDLFLHDRQTGATVLVTHAAGSPAIPVSGGTSALASMSDDGRWIVFESNAGNLVPGQAADSSTRVFLYDRESGVNTLLAPGISPRISGDGNWITFASAATDLLDGQSDTPGTWDVILQERATGQRVLVSRATGTVLTAANQHSDRPAISRDGRFVAFRSQASNLIAGFSSGTLPGDPNAWLFDRLTGSMTLVSRTRTSPTVGAGGWDPQISPDGTAVVFASLGTDLVPGQTDVESSWDLFLFDRAAGTNILVSHADASPTACAGTGGSPDDFEVGEGGAWVVFNGWDAQVKLQVRLFRRSDSSVILVSRSAISPTSPAQGGNSHSARARMTPDGAFVVFDSTASDLVPGQSGPMTGNVFVFDRAAGTLALASGAGGSGQATGNGYSVYPEVSADGSLAAWRTYASNLVPGAMDLNDAPDVALYDRVTATPSLATLHAPGMESSTASGFSSLVSASADGRYAVILSTAVNVVPGQVNRNDQNVFLVDRVAGTTTLVSRAAGLSTTTGDGDALDAAISADGAYVAFVSRGRDHVPGQIDTNVEYHEYLGSLPGPDVFLYDRAAGTTTLVSHAAGSSVTAGEYPCVSPVSLSADGRYVAFGCSADDLVAGQDDANFEQDVFLYDRVAGTTVLVSRKAGTATTVGDWLSGEPDLSADGRWVAFTSYSTNLIAGGTDANGQPDVFLFDRDSGQTLVVSRAAGTAATSANQYSYQPALSADGRYVVFTSQAGNLVAGQNGPQARNVFLFDRVTGTVELISRAAGTAMTTVTGAETSSVSDDGRYVAFRSTGTNLIPGQTAGPGTAKHNVFVHDRVTRQTELISPSVLSPSRTSNNDALPPVLSPDGRYLAFLSLATDLAAGATGRDVYLADRQLHTLERIAAGTGSYISATDGGIVLFTSGSPDLAAGDWNGVDDAFAWVRSGPETGDFFTVAPCRLIDTRQGQALTSGVPALVQVHGLCGIPDTATAVAINVTVIQPQGAGRLTLHPGNLSTPSTSTLNFPAGQNLANNAILALASNGEGTLGITPAVSGGAGGGTVHVIVDVSGYFH